MLNFIVGAPIVAAWLSVCGIVYWSSRRARRHQAQWERVSAGLAGLDADLDRAWAREQERIRRYQ